MHTQARALQRPGAAFAALFVAIPLTLAFSPPAYADIGDVTDAVQDTTDTVTDTVEDVADPAGDPDKGPVQETIDTVTKTVDEATGGATEPVTDEVRKLSEENLAPVDEALGGTTDGLLGGRAPGIDRGGTGGSFEDTRVLGRIRNRHEQPVGQSGAGSTDESTTGGAPEQLVTRDPVAETQSSGSLADQAERIAREIAFPLVLLLMVAAFLTIQSRWDKRDPKLALAPLDIDEQYLSFR